MDIADKAQDIIEGSLKRAIDAATGPLRNPAGAKPYLPPQDCEDCGDSIPRARRKAVPGCTRCVSCQAEFERMKRYQRDDDDEAA
jgi:phage/conjugal plasmid C-4 type zinc finger TraR family protein